MKLAEMNPAQLLHERNGHASSIGELTKMQLSPAPVQVTNQFSVLRYTDEAKDILIERLIAYSNEALAEIDRLLGALK